MSSSSHLLGRLAPVLCGIVFGLAPGVSAAQHAEHAAQKSQGAAGQGAAKAARKPPASLSIGAAFAPSGELWVTGLDEQSRLFVQTSADLGRTWGERRVLDSQGDRIAADGENRPKIAFGPKPPPTSVAM